jgi:ribosomal protein L11 methylase PrmA
MPEITRHPASFKDPSGFIYHYNGKIYRQVNKVYSANYNLLKDSGLLELLISEKLLIRHDEIKENHLNDNDWLVTLLPEQIPFWSYPYEWCFDQLKEAALLTLDLLMISITKGMILKDATPFNVQFYKGKPVFIDTLSFEKYDESHPWVAYRQFCESFLYPLLLSHYHKSNFQNQLSVYPDGLPVNFVAKLLPAKSNLNLGVWLHVHLPNKMSKRIKNNNPKPVFSKNKLTNLVNHLKSIIKKLDGTNNSNWTNYYKETISGGEYHSTKETIVTNLLKQVNGNKLLDLGANDGFYSLLASKNNFEIVAVDNDDQSINNLYKRIQNENIDSILPLCIDISNPSSSSGFSNKERNAFDERINADVVLVLALVHHLTIGKNIPFDLLAPYFSKLAPQLIIEFVPKDDEKTQLLLKNRKDVFTIYTIEEFEKTFQQYFTIALTSKVPDTERLIYLMKRKTN